MSKIMPNSTQEEKLRWIKPILDKRISIKNMALVCPFSERAIKYWLSYYRKDKSSGLKNRTTRPKTQPNETPIRIKERVIELRKETAKCAIKLKWQLEKEGIYLHVRTVGKIIKAEGLARKYRVRKVKYKYIKSELRPGELIEIDVKFVPYRLDGKRYYQYTAIDCASRWRYIAIYDDQSSSNSIEFLREVIKRFPYKIRAVKTDNHATFTNRYIGYMKSADPFNPKLHMLDEFCINQDIAHYLIDPGKPQQQGTVERSHRSDQESFYDRHEFKSPDELQYKLKLWNMYYNDLEHCGLNGLTPNQVLRDKVQNVRT
jgi:transposase InsO family protein